ncbi:C2 domain-containing protein At1g53590-like isoform X1 [Dioscorea cayenensis subsp. rotundata]|uniref:C2 domain-containing protein At1g53590-like isoform X1 n=2 Tax=Dioscorea cayennensis subsp. rotundata TaxID=55577 RepID=A0AB40B576_DIOCR|nr:C2 domain-containing protein At1g53590-like isoform X1 [Dioscorea cayenensis subsp. rotundata]
MDVTEISIVHHVALVLLALWIFAYLGLFHPVLYFISLIYVYRVNEHYNLRLRRRLQFEERKAASQRRLLSDTESVRWLNHAVAKIWPICMEEIASQQFLMPIIPWFLDKFKPWTARKAVVQHLYLGRNPPMFTDMRVLRDSPDDDHLVLELGMSFLSADDMSAILAVQLRKRVGFGISANMHMTGMHIEGKILVGVKFLRHWPFIGRVRVCFVEQPYIQLTVKPIFSHGIDVTELPGIAGWLDKILAVAFEQTLVEPNMMVIDVQKFVSAPTENWFTVDEKRPIAFAKVEILEANDMKPSDLNGLADPYVKGQLGPYRFRTKIQKKTLSPKWMEEFKIPISSWEVPNVLVLEVRDKDHIFDDLLGDCSININELRGGQRHDKWISLCHVKIGRLHLAITLLEGEEENQKGKEKEKQVDEEESPKRMESTDPRPSSVSEDYSNVETPMDKSKKMADEFEAVDIEGQEKTGIWVHHPGSDVSQTWEPRKGRVLRTETTQLYSEDNSNNSPRSACSSSENSIDENTSGNRSHKPGTRTIRKGLHKIGSMFRKTSKNDNLSLKNQSPRPNDDSVLPSPGPNLRAVGDHGSAVKLIVDDACVENIRDEMQDQKSEVKVKTSKQGSGKLGHIKSSLGRKSSKKLTEEAVDMADNDSSHGGINSSNDSMKHPFVVEGASIDATSLCAHDEKSGNNVDEI